MTYPFCLEKATVASEPYPFFYRAEALEHDTAAQFLDWLEVSHCWGLTEADFYEQHEFSLLDAELPPELRGVCSASTLDRLGREVGEMLDVRLGMPVDAVVHKLVKGQRIRIHNDFIEGGETHRLLVQLNRGWEEEHGGLLMVFENSDVESCRFAFRPLHRLAFGFAISPRSHHAVSLVNQGERFTLVYSFRAL